ncbi:MULTISPECIES: hypothetical protein [unclassified Methylobacterium]|uniref:hypothetical protein n=1 Tax=unclassified Methylobacterium TaxID=2615210 RepID=UPI0002DE8B9E|nr:MULTISPECIES: hypothetical protein [Methylobacterium]WFT81944.1 hypothetical protein QA634_08830 [Methylobacterium nodulans]
MSSPPPRTIRRAERRERPRPPLTGEETALPGHLLVLLSRLHRAELASASRTDPAAGSS